MEYQVTIPLGDFSVILEADSREDAIDKAWDMLYNCSTEDLVWADAPVSVDELEEN